MMAKKDWRHNLEHMGDSFADMLGAVGYAVTGTVTGVFIGYHICRIKKQRGHVVSQIGERVIDMRRDNPNLFSGNEEMSGLFTDYDNLEENRKDYVKQQEEIKAHIRESFSSKTDAGTEEDAGAGIDGESASAPA